MISNLNYIKQQNKLLKIFLCGVKPAIALNKEFESNTIKRLQNTYPYYEIGNLVIFFQEESKRDEFIAKGGRGHALVGEYLGYPPSAIKSFLSKPPLEQKVRVDYHGIVFMTDKASLADDLEWLNNTSQKKHKQA